MKSKVEEEKSKIQNEIIEIEAKKKQTIAELEAEAKQWEEKFNNREPRPEDIERIRKLEQLIKERSEAIEKVKSELKHYQSELLNRETTYNKVFNNKPQIGVLSALERKVKRDAMMSSLSMTTTLPPLPNSKGGDSPSKEQKP